MATVARPAIGELLLRVLSAALQVPVAAPRNKALRARTVALLHRYVEVLGATVLPYMPRALEVLLCDGLDAEDTVDVMGLLVQLVCRFKVCLPFSRPHLHPPQACLPPHCIPRYAQRRSICPAVFQALYVAAFTAPPVLKTPPLPPLLCPWQRTGEHAQHMRVCARPSA